MITLQRSEVRAVFVMALLVILFLAFFAFADMSALAQGDEQFTVAFGDAGQVTLSPATNERVRLTVEMEDFDPEADRRGFIVADRGNCERLDSLGAANVIGRVRNTSFSAMNDGMRFRAVTDAFNFNELSDANGSALLFVDFEQREILNCAVISPPQEMMADETMQAEQGNTRAEPADLGVEIGRVLGAPNPAMASGSGDVRWILPGPRALDPDVFGTPDNPLGYVEPIGVPLDRRLTTDDGSEYTTTQGPTAHSDLWEPVEGSFTAEVVDITAVASETTEDRIDAVFEFTSPDGEHEYRVVVNRALPSLPNYENFGGVALNTVLHGDTHIGTMLQPEQFTYLTLWGVGELYVDDEQVADNRLVHLMVTESVRNENYALVFDTGLGFDDIMAHLILPPLEVTEQGPRQSPVPTEFVLPNGQEQPFFHIMYEHIDTLRGEVTDMDMMDMGDGVGVAMEEQEAQATPARDEEQREATATPEEAMQQTPTATPEQEGEQRTPTATPTAEEETAADTTEETVRVSIAANNLAFNKDTVSVPTGSHVIMEFTNNDQVPHNWAAYRTSDAQDEIFVGRIFSGPDQTVTYEFDAPDQPGTYYFQCDVHPFMNGDFVVE